ncbi:MAG: right-handed parallel beta-helix repeat-containing protein [Sedimentisphaerales bacterium]
MRNLTLISVCLLLAIPCQAEIITVDDDGPADFNNIQAAIDDSNDGDTIIVADGTYTGQGNRDISFIDKVITLRSENGPDNCIIDCNGSEFDRHSGFYFINCDDSNTVLDGFTITNAYQNIGATINCDDSSPTIINCNIRGNFALDAGGIFIGNYSSPRISNCTIAGNSGDLTGGIGCFGNPMIINCNIIGNVDRLGDEGGMRFYGNSSATVANCIIRDNSEKQISTGIGTHVSVSYSNVQGGWGGEGNIDADPCFAFGSDYHLMPDSPCIDAGTNNPPGGLPTHDPDGNARPLDGDGDTNSIADIGVYEFNAQEPLIAVSPKWMELPIARGGTYPNDQILSIRNCGGGTLVWQITEDCPWVEVSSTNGESTGEIDDITLSIYASGLPIGKYYCQLMITADGVLNSPIMVEVTVDVHPGVLHVPSEYATIQSAIDSAVDGNEIVVSRGTYYENINFGGKNIILRSTEPTNPSVVTNTIIDGSNVSSVVTFSGTESPACVLSGFTITNGRSNGYYGGGIYGSNPDGIGTLATIQYNHIVGNVAVPSGFPGAASGGGLYGCDGIIQYNVISGNIAYGGVESGSHGGGLFSCDGTIRNNIISNNSAYFGGGMYISLSNQIVSGCVFTGNIANFKGGGVFCYLGSPTFINCTFVGNSSTYGGGIFNNSHSNLNNCILWGNTPEQIYVDGGVSMVTYSDVQGGWPGQGNIEADPCFADPNNGDYHLKSQAGRWDPNEQNWVQDDVTSPCIDAGNPNSDWTVEWWPHGKRINMGAYGGTPEASMSLSDAGNIADLNTDGCVGYTDMMLLTYKWLYEAVLLPEDLDRNGFVNFTDFAIFAENWQSIPGLAYNPNPADGATNVDIYADMSWTAGLDATSHDVYFGTSSPGMFQGNQSDTTFDPDKMTSGTTYYWRINEVGPYCTITGTTWSFRTFGPTPP